MITRNDTRETGTGDAQGTEMWCHPLRPQVWTCHISDQDHVIVTEVADTIGTITAETGTVIETETEEKWDIKANQSLMLFTCYIQRRSDRSSRHERYNLIMRIELLYIVHNFLVVGIIEEVGLGPEKEMKNEVAVVVIRGKENLVSHERQERAIEILKILKKHKHLHHNNCMHVNVIKLCYFLALHSSSSTALTTVPSSWVLPLHSMFLWFLWLPWSSYFQSLVSLHCAFQCVK